MYTLQHDDPDWPSDLDRTISTHDQLEDALDALSDVLDRHRRQVSARGEGPAVVQLAVVDDTGHALACAVHDGLANSDPFPELEDYPDWSRRRRRDQDS